jgi:anti-anti-sigma factor
MSESMVSLLPGKDTTVLKLQGDCRVDAARLLLDQLLQSPANQNVVVDWEKAEHVDTCVLQVLLSLKRHLGQRGFSLSAVKDNPVIREYLQLAGLSGDLPLQSAESPTREEIVDA